LQKENGRRITMRKVLILFCLLLMATGLFAQNNAVYVPAADVHDGSPGAGSIDINGNLNIDDLAPGGLVCFDVMLTATDFTLAGLQFELNFPANLYSMSEVQTDWANGTGATARSAGILAGVPIQGLPADNAGALIATTPLQNAQGKMPIGQLITDPPQRPAAGAGGVILRVCFTYNPSGLATCVSAEEVVRIPLNAGFTGPADDIFANDLAGRVTVNGAVDIEATVLDANANWVRSDFNQDGTRNALDALGSALCALGGVQADCGGNWPSATVTDFTQTFDYNCDGNVNALDALPLARLSLDLQNRTPLKSATSLNLTQNGSMVVEYGRNGAMAAAQIALDGVKVHAPSISDAARDAGWALVHERDGDALTYMVLNTSGIDTPIPSVRFDYEITAKSAGMTMIKTAHQTADFNEFGYLPSLVAGNDRTVSDRPERDKETLQK
jgi:hypothetical protein